MAEHHRKIELQSPDDLQYLISNVRRAANEKIDKDLPPIEGEDRMRRRVEELYISTVFHATASNITINGLPPTPEMIKTMLSNPTSTSSIEEHEPFETRLWERAKQAAQEEEELIEEIAGLRRNIPGVAVENAKAAWKGGLEDDERLLRGAVEGIKERDTGKGWEERGGLGVGGLDRAEAVEKSWEKGVKGLEGLKGSLPETVAKAERAGRAEGYMLRKEKR
ncbi:hypothetical protein D0Z07_6990 [Hyphodiscus hymeniophilus]|uniref:Uncharacterized protein n=1 Tax=Hyphodiscus hymeniophilus TaxID=353542 RepID=A0A9P6VG32_9HELO|nr:hypothetical protein D0Z07_6990 [Hyphodiscus hymeniophilus]